MLKFLDKGKIGNKCSIVIDQGPVVQRLISANPGLNFNPGFYISLFKSRFGIILPTVFRAFNYQIVVKKK